MNHSEQLNELFSALAKAQGEMPMALMTGYNPHFRSNFADMPDLVRASRPALAKYGLSVSQVDWVDDNGKCFLKTILGHSSGQWVESIMAITPSKNDVQGIMSYRSYVKRYAYASIVGVVASDEPDDDGNAAVEEPRTVMVEKPAYVEKVIKEQLDQLEEELKDDLDIAKRVMDGLKIQSLKDMPKNVFLPTLNRIRELKRLQSK